jgi:hypothetical protein
MDFKRNYPRFGFPDSVNREMYSICLTTDCDEYNLELDRDYCIIDLNIFANIPVVNLKFNDYQKFPVLLAINSPSVDMKVNTSIELLDGTIHKRQFNGNVGKISMFSVQPTQPVNEIYGYVIGLDKAQEGAKVNAIEKNVGMTYAEAKFALDKNVATFSGKIPYYKANDSLGRVKGNRVGVQIVAPDGINEEKTKFLIDGAAYDYLAMDVNAEGKKVLNWWPLITAAGQEKTIIAEWIISGSCYRQEYLLKIAQDATLNSESEALEN